MADTSDKLVKTIDQQLAAAGSAEEIERLVKARGELLLQTNPVRAIDRRIADTADPLEMALVTKLRGELIRQNEEVSDNAHNRSLERIELIGRQLLSFAALGAGMWLVPNHWFVGFIVLGAAVYKLAPKFVLTALKNAQGGKEDDEE